MNLEGKSILVTGAGGLLGGEICRALTAAGASVFGATHDTLELASQRSADECVQACVGAHGKIDVLINNAAIVNEDNTTRFEDADLGELEEALRVNTIGTVRMTQAAVRQMLKQDSGGGIINVASVYSVVAPNRKLYPHGHKPVDYVVSKSYLPNFTRYIAAMYAPLIRCNAVAPHGVYNDHGMEFLQRFGELSPYGRMANLAEIGGAFVYLASDASSYVSGQTLLIDGAWSAQ